LQRRLHRPVMSKSTLLGVRMTVMAIPASHYIFVGARSSGNNTAAGYVIRIVISYGVRLRFFIIVLLLVRHNR
jgi:hypothetical protein